MKTFLFFTFFFFILTYLHSQNVGIGTTLPLAQLHTTGTVLHTGITQNNGLTKLLVQDNIGLLYWREAGTLGNKNVWLIKGNTSIDTLNEFLGTLDYNPLILKTNALQRMIISSNGNVGVGTSDPVAQLHTTGSVRFNGINNNNALSKILAQDNSGNLAWRDASTLGGNGAGWQVFGNNGTTPVNNFLGTTDESALNIRTNNVQRVKVNTSANNNDLIGGVVDITVDSLKANGSGIALYRNANVKRWGTGIEFQMNNSIGQKTFYGRVNGGIESNTAGQENGILAFEVATNGQLGVFAQQVKMLINSKGFVGIGELYPTAQLHTNGSVLLSGITNNDTYNKILVQDNAGLLFWRDALTLNGNANWGLTGNNGTTNNNFLGTSDANALIIRTNNVQRVKVNTSEGNNSLMGGVLEVNVDSLKLNGSGLAIYRNSNVTRWGTGIEYQMNNSLGQKTFYGRVNAGIESNIAGSENGWLAFEVATKGQVGVYTEEVKMVITSNGSVGIGTIFPTAQLHTTSTVRFQNLQNGLGNYLVVDGNGNVSRSNLSSANRPANSLELKDLQIAVENLKAEILELKKTLNKIK